MDENTTIEKEVEKDKRYYWLKLDRRFFKQHEIIVIEGLPNGKDYILFYLKLLCESVSHEGSLRFSDEIPYDEAMLASITNTNIDIVRAAVQIFTKLHMMEILDDGTYFMNQVQGMIGSETDWAKKKREYRERLKELEERGQSEDNVLTLSDKSTELKSSDVKKIGFVSKDTHPTKESIPETEEKSETAAYQGIKAHDVANAYRERFNAINGVTKCEKMLVKREMAVDTILQHFSVEEIDKVFTNIAQSNFLRGDNDYGFVISFDWLFNINNFAKVLEGNYDNAKGRKGSKGRNVPTDLSGQYAGFKADEVEF